MRVAIRNVRLSAGNALAFEQAGADWASVLPGAGYPAQAPLLWYARRAAQEAGRNVLVVTDVFDRQRDEPIRWVEVVDRQVLDIEWTAPAQPFLKRQQACPQGDSNP